MKQWGMAATAVLVVVMTVAAQTREGWTLVWADEFDRDGLPDPAKWTYEKGFVRNKEAQYYTVSRAENARVESGRLIIEGRKEAYTAPDGKTASYTAASVTTDGTFALTYGRVEVKAKLPRGRGMWPAIWMLGTSIHGIGWPRCGEIDIMEAWANRTLVVSTRSEGPLEMLEDGVDGLFADKADALDLARAIQLGLTLPATARDDMVAAGFRKLETNFSEAAIVATYQALYRKLTQA